MGMIQKRFQVRAVNQSGWNGSGFSTEHDAKSLDFALFPGRRVHGGHGQTRVSDTLVTSQPSGLIRYFCL